MYKHNLQSSNTVTILVKYDGKKGVTLALIPAHGDEEWSKRQLL